MRARSEGGKIKSINSSSGGSLWYFNRFLIGLNGEETWKTVEINIEVHLDQASGCWNLKFQADPPFQPLINWIHDLPLFHITTLFTRKQATRDSWCVFLLFLLFHSKLSNFNSRQREKKKTNWITLCWCLT